MGDTQGLAKGWHNHKAIRAGLNGVFLLTGRIFSRSVCLNIFNRLQDLIPNIELVRHGLFACR